MENIAKRIRELRGGKEYRPVVCMVVLNRACKVLLVCSPKTETIGGFVFPQGGIEEGEELCLAISRELLEELGIREGQLEVIKVDLFYAELDAELGRRNRRGFSKGKAYFGALVLYSGPNELNVSSKEIKEYRWLSPQEAIELSKQTASKQKVELICLGLKLGLKAVRRDGSETC